MKWTSQSENKMKNKPNTQFHQQAKTKSNKMEKSNSKNRPSKDKRNFRNPQIMSVRKYKLLSTDSNKANKVINDMNENFAKIHFYFT